MTLTSVQVGDRLATLRRLAARVAEAIDVIDSAHHVETLAGRLALLLKEIAELEPGDGPSDADEIAAASAGATRQRCGALGGSHGGRGGGREHR